jgi:hypothetical protein
MYTVYFGPPGSATVDPLDQSNRLAKTFVDLPEALLWAHRAAANGSVVLRIEGGGIDMDRSEIAASLKAVALGS